MRLLLIIILKEIKDNLRDKNAFVLSIIFGPILMPLMIIAGGGGLANSWKIDYDKESTIYIDGLSKVPNLVSFLAENNLVAQEAPENYQSKISDEALDLVIQVDEQYAQQLNDAQPALLTLYFNSKKKSSNKLAQQVRRVINRYDKNIAGLRMHLRGFDSKVIDVINLVEEDQYEESFQGAHSGRTLAFLLIYAMAMGGLYLAADIFPGERDKGTLEALWSLPVSRFQLLIAKALAVIAFLLIGCALTGLFSYLATIVVALKGGDSLFDFLFSDVIKAFFLLVPLAFMIAALMVFVAVLVRTVKAAQASLGFITMIFIAPYMALVAAPIKATSLTLSTPVLGQYLLLERIGTGEAIALVDIAMASGSVLAVGVVLFIAGSLIYKNESGLT